MAVFLNQDDGEWREEAIREIIRQKTQDRPTCVCMIGTMNIAIPKGWEYPTDRLNIIYFNEFCELCLVANTLQILEKIRIN